MRVPIRKSEQFKKSGDDGGPLYVTKEGLENLQNTLKDLQKRQLPQAQEDTRRTGEFGDFSENAEYQEAKARMRGLHARILGLKEKIKRAVVIKCARNGRVGLGSTVVVEVGGAQKTYEIVGPHETNPSRGRISHISPLGVALVGHATGDHAALDTANGKVIYQIIEIR